jgi:hypothetical protein
MNGNATNYELAINKWLSFNAESANNYPDGINQIYQGEIDGMMLKGVFSQSEMLEVKHKLVENKNYQLESVVYGTTLGSVLMTATGDMEKYFQNAASFRAELNQLFTTSFEARVETIFSKMSGGRTVETPKENDERIYTPATIRFVHPNLGGMLPHKNNDYVESTFYNYLSQVAKLKDALSYYIVINKPEEGGDLLLFDLSPEESMDLTKNLDLENCQKRYMSPDVGDMILFHGGNIVHQIIDVKGEKTRITIGGFVAFSKDDQKIFYWS